MDLDNVPESDQFFVSPSDQPVATGKGCSGAGQEYSRVFLCMYMCSASKQASRQAMSLHDAVLVVRAAWLT